MKNFIEVILIFLLAFLSSCSPKYSPLPFEPTTTSSPIPTATTTPIPQQLPTISSEVIIQNVELMLISGDYDRARNEFNDLLKYSSNEELIAESLWGLARIEFLRNYYDQSLVYIDELQSAFPESAAAKRSHYLQGQNLFELGRYSDAADSFGNYLMINPGLIDSHVQEKRGDSFSYNGDFQNALIAYQSISSGVDNRSSIEIKIAKMYKALGEYSSSIEIYQDILNKTFDDYQKAQMDFLIGQIYYIQGLFESAYPYFKDAVENYPIAYDSYSSLVTLVNDGIPVDDFSRGLVNYFAGNYGNALAAFDRFINAYPINDGDVVYYKALTLREQGEYQLAIDLWTTIINEFPENRYWDSAWDEKAYTQWGYMEKYQEGAQTLLDYVSTYPTRPNAPFYLNSAARILERGGLLEDASSAWERLSIDYPESELVPDALFNAGITLYRLKSYNRALVIFQKDLIFSYTPSLQARAYLWIGKTQLAEGDTAASQLSFQLAAGLDPTDYYSLRAMDLLTGKDGFSTTGSYNFSFNYDNERSEAEAWLRVTFQLPSTMNLSGLGELIRDERISKGTEFWRLGLYDEATNEFNDLFQSITDNPEKCFRLANYLQELGFHRIATESFRQVLRIAGMETYTQMLNAPIFFQHMNYGFYFLDLIIENAKDYNFDPLLIMSLIAQESAFDAFINSSAGAVGLMQIMPTTGESIANSINWPLEYSASDLIRPIINTRLGTAYLTMNRNYFDGDLYLTLAAYNAGPGNVDIWRNLSGSDQDLFLEIIRYPETRNYIENIYELFDVYRTLYEVN